MLYGRGHKQTRAVSITGMNPMVIMKTDEGKMNTTHSTAPFKFEDVHGNNNTNVSMMTSL